MIIFLGIDEQVPNQDILQSIFAAISLVVRLTILIQLEKCEFIDASTVQTGERPDVGKL